MVVSDHAITPGEVPDLWLPRAQVSAVLVDPDQWRALASLFPVEINAVDACRRHDSPSGAIVARAYRRGLLFVFVSLDAAAMFLRLFLCKSARNMPFTQALLPTPGSPASGVQ